MSIHLRPLTPHIGAEVERIDPAGPSLRGQVRDIHAAMDRHAVLVFHISR